MYGKSFFYFIIFIISLHGNARVIFYSNTIIFISTKFESLPHYAMKTKYPQITRVCIKKWKLGDYKIISDCDGKFI